MSTGPTCASIDRRRSIARARVRDLVLHADARLADARHAHAICTVAGKTTGRRKSHVVVARIGPSSDGPPIATPIRWNSAIRADSNQLKISRC